MLDRKYIKNTLVYAFVVATDDQALGECCEYVALRLLEEFASRRGIDDRHLAMFGKYIAYRSYERGDGEYGTGSSAIGKIVDSSGIAYAPISEIMQRICKEPFFLGSLHDARIEIWTQTLSKKRKNMNVHIYYGVTVDGVPWLDWAPG